MSEVLKPILPEQYEGFYREMYSKSEDGMVFSQFRVSLDKDPSLNPKSINEKIAQTQSLKDRLVVILNRAVKNEQYWSNISRRLENKLDSEIKMAALTPEVKTAGNSEGRVAKATEIAKKNISTNSFKGEFTFDAKMAEIDLRRSEAIAFLAEVKNLWSNIDSANMGLAVQLKSVMVNMRLYNPTMPGTDRDMS